MHKKLSGRTFQVQWSLESKAQPKDQLQSIVRIHIIILKIVPPSLLDGFSVDSPSIACC
ncbi:hypothetical protein [Sphingobacterium mizutaii]|uniref:hypothetical protein n=1 Tax=Sphingobacterium mizutaii TaxID=1010 RepID=UPI0028965C6C|nr:hypothetical protein [Sphingobacterium mizutaii]